MKKLFLLAAGIMIAAGVNAQTLPVQGQCKRVPNASQEFQKQVQMPVQSIMANPTANTTVEKNVFAQKSTYTKLGWLSSYSYGINFAGSDNLDWKGAEIDLFPDSLVLSDAWYITDEENWEVAHALCHKTGFTFDPMSFAFDDEWEEPLFGSVEVMEGEDMKLTTRIHNPYRVDSLMVRFDYIAGPEKDTVLLEGPYTPDTVRVYMAQYPIYQKGRPGINEDYRWLHYVATGVGLVLPKAEFVKDASAKGSATRMQSTSLKTYDYILNPYTDTTSSSLGYVGWKGRYVDLGEGYEVEAGNVLCVMMEYLPGYSYDLNDTLSVTKYNRQSQEFLSKETRLSTLSVPACNHKDENGTAQFDWLLDQGGGSNGRLMEDNDVRYNMMDEESLYAGYYVHYYYAMPMMVFCLSVSDDELEVVDTTIIKPDTDYVLETKLLVNNVYPNPVQDQIKVNLANDGNATAILYNLVGQEVKRVDLTAQVSTIDVADLSRGIYMLKVNQGGVSQTVKITKR
ncbi:MAG: T9SS type A sorting domain-containing protein [Bacteroidales bacterium]|nr:T9SS type A sorting domain-containing protein [Bacteroidales bacterium]